MRCCCRGMWTGKPILKADHLKGRWLHFCKHIYFVLFAFAYRLISPAAAACSIGNVVGILLGQVSLREVLSHLSSLHLSYFLLDIACVLLFLMWNHFLLLDQCMFKVRCLGRVWTYIIQMYLLVRLQQLCQRSRRLHQVNEPLLSCFSQEFKW